MNTGTKRERRQTVVSKPVQILLVIAVIIVALAVLNLAAGAGANLFYWLADLASPNQ